jgi:hypothetical protein
MPVFRVLAAIAPKDGVYAHWGAPTVQLQNHYTGVNLIL